jgi:site-specific DNA recombinase
VPVLARHRVEPNTRSLTMPTAVTYCRVSSEEQAEKDISIPAQRKALRRWAHAQPGLEVVADFEDKGQSAYAPADKRPGFMTMLSFCKRKDVDLILVHKLDRFSRNQEESILFKSMLRTHGVQVRSITENFDRETPQGYLYEGMIEVINQFYSMNLATETLKGMRENAERGYHNGGRVPYGYRLQRIVDERGREHSQLVPGPDDEVAVVREIFEMSADQGMGMRSIATELNRRGVRGPRSKHWTQGTICWMLQNRVYCGDKVWFKSKKKGRRSRQRTEEGEHIVVTDSHEALITRELFERRAQVAETRPFNVTNAPTRHVNYLLSRLIVCGHCGNNFGGRKNMVRQPDGTRKPVYRYYCSGYIYKGKSVCTSFPLDKDWVEGVVLELIRARLCAPDALADLESRIRERITERQRAYGQDARTVERKLEEIEHSIQNYYEAIGAGLDPLVCQRHITALTAKKETLEAEAAVLQKEDYYQRAMEKNVQNLRRFASAFEEGFDTLPFAVQRQVVLHFVEKIEVVDRAILRVTLKVPFDNDGIELLTDEVEGGGASGNEQGSSLHYADSGVEGLTVSGWKGLGSHSLR